MNKQESKIAVVTGAGGTLCSEMARELAKMGYKVALIGRTKENLETVEQQITELGGEAISLSADVKNMEQVRTARDEVMKKWGACQVLINGAGGNQMPAITNINEFDEKEIEDEPGDTRGFFNLDMVKFLEVLDINIMGTVIPCQVFGKDMTRNSSGSIINFASMSSFQALSRVPAYGTAKTGIVFFTEWLAAYLAPAGIRVNAIAPGFFINERNRYRLLKEEGGYTDRGEQILNQTPLKRFGEASELTGAMKWLIDQENAGFVTGITVPVDGGFLACPGI